MFKKYLKKIKFCSLSPSEKCGRPKVIEVNQIELYDGTKHLLRDLNIAHIDMLNRNYECIGKGQVTGSPQYCKHNFCNEEGTRFCFFRQYELTILVTEEGEIPIKNWGAVMKKIYYWPEQNKERCKECEIECAKQGIKIIYKENIGGVEIFLGGNKEMYIPHPKNKQIIYLPTQQIISEYEVFVKFWKNGELVADEGIKCPAQKHCELIECTFCLQMIINPQCAPKSWIVIFVISLYFTLGILLMICRILKLGLGGMLCIARNKWKLCKFIGRCLARKNKKKKSEHFKPDIKKHTSKLPKEVMLLILLSVLSPIQSLEIISAKDEHCIVEKNGHRTCSYENVLELNFGLQSQNGQESQILLQDSGNRPTGKINLKLNAIQAVCVRTAKFFTRDFELGANSVYLCSGEGSCSSQEKCENIGLNESIKEIPKSNHYPGTSGCINSCKGHLFCENCYYSSYTCLFYRCYAEPKSKEIFEIFECPEFNLQLNLNISIETMDQKFEKELRLRPGFTETFKDIKLTATSMTVPPIPALGRSILTDGNIYAIISKKQEKSAKRVFCPNIKEAAKFSPKCLLQPDICKCEKRKNKIQCGIQNGPSLKDIIRGENVLPLIHNGLLLKNEGKEIVAISEITAAILQIRLAGASFKAQIELNTCKIIPYELEGCYGCEKGAILKLQCVTDFGRTLSSIICPSFTSAITCEASKQNRTLSIHLDHADIDEECEAFCPSSTTRFRIFGKLSSPEVGLFESGTWDWTARKDLTYKIDWLSIIKNFAFSSHFPTFLLSLTFGGILIYFLAPILLSLIFAIFSYLVKSFLRPRSVGNNRLIDILNILYFLIFYIF